MGSLCQGLGTVSVIRRLCFIHTYLEPLTQLIAELAWRLACGSGSLLDLQTMFIRAGKVMHVFGWVGYAIITREYITCNERMQMTDVWF